MIILYMYTIVNHRERAVQIIYIKLYSHDDCLDLVSVHQCYKIKTENLLQIIHVKMCASSLFVDYLIFMTAL